MAAPPPRSAAERGRGSASRWLRVRAALTAAALLVAGIAVFLTRPAASPERPSPDGCRHAVGPSGFERSLAAARPGGVICLQAGRYATPPLPVWPQIGALTIRAQPGAGPVVLAGLDVHAGSGMVTVEGVTVAGRTQVGPGVSDVTIRDSDLAGVDIAPGARQVSLIHDALHAPGSENGVNLNSTCGSVAHSPDPSSPCSPAIGDVLISGCRFRQIGRDAVFAGHFDGLRIVGNDISGVREKGQHSDVLQTVYGGQDLEVARNWIHDFAGQGIFVQNGPVRGVDIDDNLIVRDRDIGPSIAGPPIALNDVAPYVDGRQSVVRRNTVWSNSQGMNLGSPYDDGMRITGNVLEYFSPGTEELATHYARAGRLDEHGNVLGGGWAWQGQGRAGAGDRLGRDVSFRDAASDDYRIQGAGPVDSPGVSWRPVPSGYGPRVAARDE